MIGVNHADPLGRLRLQGCLLKLIPRPRFVGVEYDSHHLPAILAQRPRFRGLIDKEWGFLSAEDRTTIERSLGYDGDTPFDILPDAQVLWLDEGRRHSPFADSHIEDFAEGRLDTLRAAANSLVRAPAGFLEAVSRNVWAEAVAGRATEGDARDRAFAEVVASRLPSGQAGLNAAVIVGASHARREVPGSFVRCLEEHGFRYRTTILEPPPG